VQDESAMLVVDVVAPEAGETIVDLCAAPGGKALGIAERGLAGARVVAVDRPARLARLRENAAREGLAAAPLELLPGDALSLEPVPADAVLVDAPCSGLGVVRRRADLRWTKREGDAARLARIQGQLLDAAARWVKPGGRLIYSTCTVLRAENEEVALAFLERRGDFRLEPLPAPLASFASPDPRSPAAFLRTWPHRHDMDGAFACRFRRAL
jgi:16S rRNA (cytosine967-C5)-methyltransferase